MLTNVKVMEAQSTDKQVHYSSYGATVAASMALVTMEIVVEPRPRIVATRRPDGIGIADRRKDTVESSAQQASQVWSALTALDEIILLLCAEVRRIY